MRKRHTEKKKTELIDDDDNGDGDNDDDVKREKSLSQCQTLQSTLLFFFDIVVVSIE